MEQSNPDRICVQVFAKIAAAISHEIKNTLSIINENAGLLDDYVQMAEQTGGLPLDRVLSTTAAIAKQVERSNVIMKDLNRYAHSGDTSLAHANLKETLSLMVALTNRQAAMKEIHTSVECPPDIAIYTHLIFFESLIYLTLINLYENCEDGGTFSIQVVEKQPEITLCFKSEDTNVFTSDSFPDDQQQLLAEPISASYRIEKNHLHITFPANID